MSFLDLIFRTKKPVPLPDGAVTVDLTGPVLQIDGKLLRESDAFAALEDKLIDAVEQAGLGLFDCNEVEDNSARLFFYGEDADRLADCLQAVLQTSSLGTHARLLVRRGGPGSPQRIVQL